MDCPSCSTQLVTFSVPESYREYVPSEQSSVGICPHCLELHPTEDAPATPDFTPLGTAFPSDPDAAVPMALIIGLLENLALYRSEISTLLADVETAGVDPLLVLDRLEIEPSVETELDLSGRRRQLEQLL